MGRDIPASHFAGAFGPYLDTQTEWASVFGLFADLPDEDGALAEMKDLDDLTDLLNDLDGSRKG